ncbi:MAG: hypothetical protein ABI652_00075 [Acidobacteriota bacterium]
MDAADRDTVLGVHLPPAQDRVRTSLLLTAALLGLVLRLAFALGYWHGQPLTRDEQEYLSLARSLAAGQGFVYDDVMRAGPLPPFGRAPGYPAFLAVVGGGHTVVRSVPTSVKVAQSIVGACGVLMVGLIAGRLAGSRAGHAAAFIAAAYPPLVWIAAYAFSESIFWPLSLVAVWMFDHGSGRRPSSAPGSRAPGVSTRRRELVWFFACGVVTALGILIRPALLFFLPLAGVWLLWHRRSAAAAAMAAGVLILLLPWTARNYASHGTFVLVASDGGVTFWTGNHPLATGDGDMAANPALKIANLELRAQHPGLSEEEMEPIYYREALAWMRAHPFTWLGLEVRKLMYVVLPIGPSYFVHSRLYSITSVVSYGLLLPIALAGLVRLGPRRPRAAGLWLLAASAVAVCLVFFPQERFRIPTLDPTLIVCAGAIAARRERV